MSNGAAASHSAQSPAGRKLPRAGESPQPVDPDMRTRPVTPPRPAPPRRARGAEAARVFGLMGISIGTHMAILGILGFMPHRLAPRLPKEVEMEIIAPEPKPPPPPPPPAADPPKPQEPPAPKPRPKLAPRPAPKPASAPEPPPQAEPEPVAEAPVDLTGVTLTGDDGASWSSVVGNGAALQGPAPRIAKVTGRDRPGAAARPAVVGPTMVGEASLSRKPVPPDQMDALLLQNYPPRARAQGVAGTALLRVQILADGRVGHMRVLRETGDFGFGKACMKTLRARRWQPPLDRRGVPVATEIRYTCDFQVAD